MLKKERENIQFLEFELLQEFQDVSAASFLRHGGVSQENCFSLNVGFERGDDEKNVHANRALICDILDSGNSSLELVSGHQIHGNRVARVTKKSLHEIPECDALITNIPNLALMIKHADCQAALFFDPVTRSIGAAHAGWRGSVQNIYRTTIEAMQKEFGTKPENLLVAISPSLGPEAAEFRNYLIELPEAFYPFQWKSLYFDFWKISRFQLEQTGVLPHHIQAAEICTFSNPQDFFSHRFDKKSGRNATAIALRS